LINSCGIPTFGFMVTTEKYIEKVTKVHGTKYNYSKTIYTGIYNKIIIICPIHGEFIQSANDHRNKCGCQECKRDKSGSTQRFTNEIFIEKSLLKHYNNYSYEKVIYKNNRTPVEIYCKKHGGYFFQRPELHMIGMGCPRCNWDCNHKRKSGWIEKAKGRKGTFYILKCGSKNESFFKFGITFNNVGYRYKTDKDLPYRFIIIRTIVSDNLDYIWELEKRFKQFKFSDRYKPLKAFHGSMTECFKTYKIK